MYIDVSLPVRIAETDAGNLANISKTTRIVAPRFLHENGKTIDELEIGRLCGLSQVVVIPQKDTIITPMHLAKVPLHPGSRILFKTAGSLRQAGTTRKPLLQPVCLAIETAVLLADRRIALIGIDEESMDDITDAHMKVRSLLLSYEIAVLENLYLGHVNPGIYELLCLPLNFVDHSVAPCRAVLKEVERL